VAGKLADMYASTAACRAYVSTAARDADAGRASRKDCAAVILFCAEAATRNALDAIQVFDRGLIGV
jgi:isovaleryl-CoA dehydrogenase